MTKLMQKGLRRFIAEGLKIEAEYFEGCPVYDFTAVSDLVLETSNTLVVKQNLNNEMSHGGLLHLPNGCFYVEIINNNSRFGLFLEGVAEKGGGAFALRSVITESGAYFDMTGVGIAHNEDKYYLHVEKNLLPDGGVNNLRFNDALILSNLVAACFIVLNAPYGIDLEPAPVHKGQAREAKRQNRKLNPVTIIKLSKTVKPERIVSSGRGSPKGFHFVRSHSRLVRYPDTYTTVKAHWRGDPALGIHRANYKVVP